MRLYAFRILAALCALHVSGAHWFAMQAMAWTGMLVSRSQETTVVEAVRTTFDGDHPCPLCQAVEEAQKREQENSTATALETVLKLTFVRPSPLFLPFPTATSFEFLSVCAELEPRIEAPPTPPPQLA